MTELAEEITETEHPEADVPSGEMPEDEVIVTFGEEAPPPEDDEKAAPEWVRELRKKTREDARRIRELEAKIASAAPKVEQKPEPTIEDFDYDQDRFKAAYRDWMKQQEAIDREREAQKAEREAQDKAWQDRVVAYQEQKQSLKARDFDGAEVAVMESMSVTQQGIIIQGAENPAKLIYALGTNPKKAAELASIKDPVRFAFAVARLEPTMKEQTRKPSAQPDKAVVGAGRPAMTADARLEQLRTEAAKTGDYSKVMAYRRKNRHERITHGE
jgi:hypothetical protein